MLFDGSGELQDLVVAAITGAPADLPPLDVMGAAMERAAELLEQRRPFAQQRAAAIAANPSLQERELLKLAALGSAAAAALRGRGVPEPDASLAAEAGVAVFKVAFERWVDDQPDFVAGVRTTLAHLKALL